MLSDDDVAAARALWEEWTAGSPFDIEVGLIGEHRPAVMDPDRPLGAIVGAGLRLRIVIRDSRSGRVVFDEGCPASGEALRASVAVLARTVGTQT